MGQKWSTNMDLQEKVRSVRHENCSLVLWKPLVLHKPSVRHENIIFTIHIWGVEQVWGLSSKIALAIVLATIAKRHVLVSVAGS